MARPALLAGVREAMAEARARAETAEAMATETAARNAQHTAWLAIERDKAERARAEPASIAERRARIAEDKRRPWWRRLVR